MFCFTGDSPRPASFTYQQEVKENNIKRVFDLLRSGACDSRAELVRAMALSATSISALVEELQARGYLRESGPKHTTLPGRRPIRLSFNENARYIAAFSVSRRGFLYSLLNLRCEVLESLFVECEAERFAGMDAGPDYAERFLEVLERRSRLFDPQRTVCIGVIIPGVYDPADRGFSMQSSIGLQFSGESMRALAERAGIRVFLANTTVCQAYAEKKVLDASGDGAQAVQDLLYVHVNDGVGASIIASGDIFKGSFSNAGEIGHMTIDLRGRKCSCGNRGCLERYVNLNAVLEDAAEACRAAGAEPPKAAKDLARCALEHPEVGDVLRKAASYLSCGLYNMICATGIQRIVLGGGIEVLGEDFLACLRSAVRSRSNLFCDELDLTYSIAGPVADGRGFAHCFLDKNYTITY